MSKALDSSQRSAVEAVDWHQIEEHRFTRKVAAAMEQVVRTGQVPALVVVAPPKTLAELRSVFHADVKSRVIAEINKDFDQASGRGDRDPPDQRRLRSDRGAIPGTSPLEPGAGAVGLIGVAPVGLATSAAHLLGARFALAARR